MLSYKHVSVSVSGTHILEDINIDFNDGNITTIVGPNGCGKSTLLKNIARIQKPKKGQIFLYQEDIQKMHSKQIAKKLAMLPQQDY